MRFSIIPAALALALVVPAAAQAQGTAAGARTGARDGAAMAGPVGEIVGGAVGAAAGTVGGILGTDVRPGLRAAILGTPRPVYRYDGEVVVGTVLSGTGVVYYDPPAEYGLTRYRYAHVNDRYVLVDPATHRVVEIIE